MGATESRFVPALPGTWTLAPQSLTTTNEESAHAVIAALLGLELHEARIDRPDVDVPGHVLLGGYREINCDEDLEDACYRRLLASLAGPVFIRRWDTGRWPLDEGDPGDVGIIARLCKWLDYGPVDLYLAERQVRQLLQEPSVRRALTDVGYELLMHGAIPGDRVSEIVAEAGIDEAVIARVRSRTVGRVG